MAGATDQTELNGCWIAYYGDYSDAVIFDDEIDALRHAVEHAMSVKFLLWGMSIKEDM